MNYYITGDIHADFNNIAEFCNRIGTSRRNDTIIILGDSCINYRVSREWHERMALIINNLDVNILCIHGNHEERASNMPEIYKKVYDEHVKGEVYSSNDIKNLKFLDCGIIYTIKGKRVLVIGGAYSVDKWYRLAEGKMWYPSEQPDENIKAKVIESLIDANWEVDIVLSHTCPINDRPIENFKGWVKQEDVDISTEVFLQQIKDKIKFKEWYCGHYHTDKLMGKIRFMYSGIILLN